MQKLENLCIRSTQKNVSFNNAKEKDIFSVKPLHYESISEEEKEYFDALDSFSAPYLEEKILIEKITQTKEEYEELFCEFKKFVALLAISREPLGMASKKVDLVWHQFILFTPQYFSFSNQFYGTYIHHLPKTSFTPNAEGISEKFYEWYQGIYGSLPKVWRE